MKILMKFLDDSYEPNDYNKLISAAKRKKGKNELEIYNDVLEQLNNLLNNESEQENILKLKSFIAYFKGKSSYEFWGICMQIAYTLFTCIVSVIISMKMLDSGDRIIFFIALMLAAIVIIVVVIANYASDFEREVVLCVLHNKLKELQDSNALKQDNSVVDAEISCSSSKKPKKNMKKHKKKKKSNKSKNK